MKLLRTEVILFIALLVTLMFVPIAGAVGDELHIAPLNPEFIKYMQEKPYDSQVQGGTHGLGWIPSPVYSAEVKDVQMFGPNVGDRATSYPATFDLRTTGKVSPVKDQNPWGTCWAFATYASLESTLMPATPTPDFSEKNLVNLAGFTLTDPLPQSAGGNAKMSTAYLTRWNGPVDSATDPYPTTTTGWTTSSTYPPVKHVQNVTIIPGRTSRTDNDNIKGALTRWGAVYASLYWSDTFYNSAYTSYYQPASAADVTPGSGHAVTIVGWDDAYPAANFNTAADGPGAWIVKNSWGTSWGSSGYFYVSYYDKYFGSVIQTDNSYKDTAVFLGESTSNFDTVYSYDKLGQVSAYWELAPKTGSFANVFTANSSETIKAVGFYTTDLNVSYTISIYKNPTSGPAGSRHSGEHILGCCSGNQPDQ
jgi:C1A family cysteine protease